MRAYDSMERRRHNIARRDAERRRRTSLFRSSLGLRVLTRQNVAVLISTRVRFQLDLGLGLGLQCSGLRLGSSTSKSFFKVYFL